MFTESKTKDGFPILKFGTQDELEAFVKGMSWPNDSWSVMTTNSQDGKHTATIYEEYLCSTGGPSD